MISAVGANTFSQLFGGWSGCGFGGLCWTDGHSQKLPLQLDVIYAFVQEQQGHLQSHFILSWGHVSDTFTGSAQAWFLPWQNSLEALARLALISHLMTVSHPSLKETKIINLMSSITSTAIKKERRILNQGPYELNSRWGMILCRHLTQHAILPVLQGHPALWGWEDFGSIKIPIETQPTWAGLTCWAVHVLPVEALITYCEVLTPEQGNSATPSLHTHQGR